MKSMAEKVRRVWNGVYVGEKVSAPCSARTGIIAVDDALDWLCEDAANVIDFGCGNGTLLFLCALRGTQRHIGVDYSSEGIRLARRRAMILGRGRYRFITGGLEKLMGIEDQSQDAAILSNIADNLAPADAQFLLTQTRRIVRAGGKVLIKLNPYLGADQIQERNTRMISGELPGDGLLLWNLPTEKWAALLRGVFIIEGCGEAYYPEHEQTNRLFMLQVPPLAEADE